MSRMHMLTLFLIVAVVIVGLLILGAPALAHAIN